MVLPVGRGAVHRLRAAVGWRRLAVEVGAGALLAVALAAGMQALAFAQLATADLGEVFGEEFAGPHPGLGKHMGTAAVASLALAGLAALGFSRLLRRRPRPVLLVPAFLLSVGPAFFLLWPLAHVVAGRA